MAFNPDFWGDGFMIRVASRQYMCRISVIREDDHLNKTHYFFNGPWTRADLKLLWVGAQHYMGIGK